MPSSVLIVGAGPTGLNLALRLQHHGIPFRIVDAAGGPGTQSRALAVHARTLEFYRQLGIADRAMAAGTVIEQIRMREAGEEVTAVSLKDLGGDISPYPVVLDLPQDEHEALLGQALQEVGVRIEWNTRLTALTPRDGEVRASIADRSGGDDAFAYVAGCDGARSVVRQASGIALTGGTYERLYFVADVVPSSGRLDAEFVVALDKDAFALALPSRKGRNMRVIGYVPRGHEAEPTYADVQPAAERLLGYATAEVNWFSTYHVHHRVADRFREGRCFLLGDAGHLHSPVGGQGMNTGIGDATNLGWKLAMVLEGRAPEALLDTYEAERIAFARALVSTTDRVFQAVADRGLVGRVVREWIMPRIFPAATKPEAGRRAIFRLISQTRIAYPQSTLSEGNAGRIAGGDRLPWLPDQDNFAPLRAMNWQVHAFGEPEDGAAERLGLPVHRFAYSPAAEHAGFSEHGAYLVRPDGYVALAMERFSAEALAGYAERLGLRFT